MCFVCVRKKPSSEHNGEKKNNIIQWCKRRSKDVKVDKDDKDDQVEEQQQ